VVHHLINPADPPERQHAKLLTIVDALVKRVEQDTDDSGAAYAQFQRAVLLEDQVRDRTRDLELALDLLNQSNAKLEEAMGEAEAARRTLADAIETVEEGFGLFGPDDVLVLCNSRFGMHLPDIRDHLVPGLTFADYVDRVSRSGHLVLPGGETHADWAARRLRRHADRRVMFNAEMIWDRWVQVSEHRTADGGTVVLQTDLTDVMRIEREERDRLLDDQARLVRATLDHISQGVCIFDRDARMVGWNRRLAELLSIPVAGTRRGVAFSGLLTLLRGRVEVGPGMTLSALEEWSARGEGRPPLTFDIQSGADITLTVFAQETPDGGFVISFTDVTAERAATRLMEIANETLEQRVLERTLELEDALTQAERANAARSRFVAAASHDLLQPLSAANLFMASLSDDPLEEESRRTLFKAQNALVSVEGILGDLLDISKLEAGKAALNLGSVRLGRILKQLNDEFAPVAAAKGLRLTIVPTSAVVLSDATYLRRILQNLIGNAIRYTEAGRVLVGVRHARGRIRVSVRDTGPGIPEEEQENVFREFHRLNARASAAEGMGLGLAIVERACALLGHPLLLTSEPGRGTCFDLTLPLAAT
jgi:two-component system, sensor histidine kinase